MKTQMHIAAHSAFQPFNDLKNHLGTLFFVKKPYARKNHIHSQPDDLRLTTFDLRLTTHDLRLTTYD